MGRFRLSLPPITREWLVALAPIAPAGRARAVGRIRGVAAQSAQKGRMLTGTEQGAYAEFGRRYAQELRRYGIEVELRETRGAAENLRMLRDPAQPGDVGFVQGGSSESGARGRRRHRRASAGIAGRAVLRAGLAFSTARAATATRQAAR